MTDTAVDIRFRGIERLYGAAGLAALQRAHVCVVGLGGVGSWAVEALARSGIGKLTLIDFDVIEASNINRQIHALDTTVGVKKAAALRERVAHINPACTCEVIDDFLTDRNLEDYLARGYDCVIDAIDSIKFKAAMIYHCKRNKIPIVTTGGAGGLTDPTKIAVVDLSRTHNDPLAKRVRDRLRSRFNFTRNVKRSFGVPCVFSTQQAVYPQPDGSISCAKPGIHGISLDCRLSMGSATFVTATFGFFAVAKAIERIMKRHAAARVREDFDDAG